MMPNMNGYEMLEALRKTYTSAVLPVIMVSAKTREEDAVQKGWSRKIYGQTTTGPSSMNDLAELVVGTSCFGWLCVLVRHGVGSTAASLASRLKRDRREG
eukprot:365763-Chlamydomonas_euryale.AAC.21